MLVEFVRVVGKLLLIAKKNFSPGLTNDQSYFETLKI